MPKTKNDKDPFQKLYEAFGCVPMSRTGDEVHAEECPFCEKDRFFFNVKTGQYKCHSENSCGEQGNAYTFINVSYGNLLEETNNSDYRRLKKIRNLPLQTLKRHGLAWDSRNSCWLIPYKKSDGTVQNLLRYYEDGSKRNLPGLAQRLYGLDQFSDDIEKTLLVVEGAWDAIALDQHLREKKTRTRYDILGVPSATVWKPDWLQHLKHRTVRLCLDNDEAGQKGQRKIAKLVRENKIPCKLSALDWPEEFPAKCDIGDLIHDGISIPSFSDENCKPVATQTKRLKFLRGDEIPDRITHWMWEGHIPLGTFISLSGYMGTHKSDIARDLAARVTAGLSMPQSESALVVSDVLYFTSEDSDHVVRDLVELHGGDLTRLHIYDLACDVEPVDLLDCLEEMEATINDYGAKLIVLDALNSFVSGDITTDSNARRTLSGRLHSLAKRTESSIIGIRNWGRMEGGTSAQKALGATSLSDIARCVFNTRKIEPKKEGEPVQFVLEFEKVSNASPPEPIKFKVEDCSKDKDSSHLRKLVWPSRSFLEASTKAAQRKGNGKR